MIGAITGDIIGSVREAAGTKTKDFPLFEPYVSPVAWAYETPDEVLRHAERCAAVTHNQ